MINTILAIRCSLLLLLFAYLYTYIRVCILRIASLFNLASVSNFITRALFNLWYLRLLLCKLCVFALGSVFFFLHCWNHAWDHVMPQIRYKYITRISFSSPPNYMHRSIFIEYENQGQKNCTSPWCLRRILYSEFVSFTSRMKIMMWSSFDSILYPLCHIFNIKARNRVKWSSSR